MYDCIDFHAHIYPDAIAQKASQSIGSFYSIPMESTGTVQSLLESGDKGGVRRFVVQSVATTPKQVRAINEFVHRECAAHPDRLTGLGALHPDLDNMEEEIEHCIKLGLRGVKLHPDVQQFNMDDPRMLPVYDQMQGKLPLLIHCGDYRYDYSHPRRLAHLLDLFPRLVVVAAHFGGWSLWDLAMEFLLSRNCYLDTSSSFAFLGKLRSREIIRAYGAERIVFGVDFPMWDHKEELDALLSLGLSEEENQLILHQNAERILSGQA